jgi:hypothetical protein
MEPIVVNASSKQQMLMIGIRQFLLVCSGAATAFGATHLGSELGLLTVVAGPLAGLVTTVVGQYAIMRSEQAKRTMAQALPDVIAQVKDGPTK